VRSGNWIRPTTCRMASWLDGSLSSHRVQLVVTAVASGVCVATLILGVQTIQRKTAIDELKASIPSIGEGEQANVVRGTPLMHSDLDLLAQ